MATQPNVLFVMTDQQRLDTIAALGNSHIYTPNLDRLVQRGVAFTQAYTTCPVCVPARYTIRTGCEPPTTGVYENSIPNLVPGQAETMEERCGPYLARTMNQLGYRTFGIGKFHTLPDVFEELGYAVHLHSEEVYLSPEQRARDSYAAFIAREHPAYDFLEGLMGERWEMCYMPQMSPMPAEITVEAWAADRGIEQIEADDGRPYFGMISFVGPHPPCAPPIPFNQMYNPDRMPNPTDSDIEIDHMDEQLPYMNHRTWADDINDAHARMLRARYYGEISYIDHCLGRILDAVERREDADNTLICFYSDHGDQFGDHHAWEKACFFEQSCHVPLLVSWPECLPQDERRDELVCLTDLFGIAAGAAGELEMRDGIDVLGMLAGEAAPREYLVGYYGTPGSPRFKMMVRDQDWKYIFMANGGREQLFNITTDPNEHDNQVAAHREIADRLRQIAVEASSVPNADRALEGGQLRTFPFAQIPRRRRELFPEHPSDVLSEGG